MTVDGNAMYEVLRELATRVGEARIKAKTWNKLNDVYANEQTAQEAEEAEVYATHTNYILNKVKSCCVAQEYEQDEIDKLANTPYEYMIKEVIEDYKEMI